MPQIQEGDIVSAKIVVHFIVHKCTLYTDFLYFSLKPHFLCKQNCLMIQLKTMCFRQIVYNIYKDFYFCFATVGMVQIIDSSTVAHILSSNDGSIQVFTFSYQFHLKYYPFLISPFFLFFEKFYGFGMCVYQSLHSLNILMMFYR